MMQNMMQIEANPPVAHHNQTVLEAASTQCEILKKSHDEFQEATSIEHKWELAKLQQDHKGKIEELQQINKRDIAALRLLHTKEQDELLELLENEKEEALNTANSEHRRRSAGLLNTAKFEHLQHTQQLKMRMYTVLFAVLCVVTTDVHTSSNSTLAMITRHEMIQINSNSTLAMCQSVQSLMHETQGRSDSVIKICEERVLDLEKVVHSYENAQIDSNSTLAMCQNVQSTMHETHVTAQRRLNSAIITCETRAFDLESMVDRLHGERNTDRKKYETMLLIFTCGIALFCMWLVMSAVSCIHCVLKALVRVNIPVAQVAV
jgi:hypothetical protein